MSSLYKLQEKVNNPTVIIPIKEAQNDLMFKA
jgi:hypothetical protein